jgi:hypothetical protein
VTDVEVTDVVIGTVVTIVVVVTGTEVVTGTVEFVTVEVEPHMPNPIPTPAPMPIAKPDKTPIMSHFMFQKKIVQKSLNSLSILNSLHF